MQRRIYFSFQIEHFLTAVFDGRIIGIKERRNVGKKVGDARKFHNYFSTLFLQIFELELATQFDFTICVQRSPPTSDCLVNVR